MASPQSQANLAALAEQAAALLTKDAAAAVAAADRLLALAPGDPRGRLIRASALRRLGRAGEALALIEPLSAEFPNAANTQYEFGLILTDAGEAERAAAALRTCVRISPEHGAAWAALSTVLFRLGDGSGATMAERTARGLALADPVLRAALSALGDGRLADARRGLEHVLQSRPADPDALVLLGETAMAEAGFAEAERCFARALAIRPADDRARFQLAVAKVRQQKAAGAGPLIDGLLAREPSNAAYRNLKAAWLGLSGDDAGAIEIYEALLREAPNQPLVWLNYAQGLKTVGRRAEAIEAYRRCLALNPACGEAYWQLANIKLARFDSADLAALEGLCARADLPVEDRVNFHYALGKALEDRGEAEAAFQHYATGAAMRRASAPYDPDELTRFVEACERRLTPALLARGTGPVQAPIFVVGLPRSGSTLVEQILASHSAVEGTMELPDIGHLARGLAEASHGAGYLSALLAASPSEREALGRAYLETTSVHRRLGRARFVDKMPNNFLHIGLIALALPGARIVDVRRHPMATGFSAFKQHFAQGQLFSYDLGDLGAYYRDYVRLMRHFDRAAPGLVHRVIYEDLVAEPEGEIRKLLSYCGLAFEPACLAFHENPRAVRTVSSEQVRQPIYRSGVDHWRAFEPWLGPMKSALGETFEHWRN